MTISTRTRRAMAPIYICADLLKYFPEMKSTVVLLILGTKFNGKNYG